MDLIIDNHIISAELREILLAVKRLSNDMLFKDMRTNGNDIIVTCPMHKDGSESHPSCRICAVKDKEIPFGQVHCFSCGYSASLPKFISQCLDWSREKTASWLIDNYSSVTDNNEIYLPELIKPKQEKEEIDISNYCYYHPYMWKRKLSEEVVDEFQIGYDKETDSLVFPVWDYNNNLVMLTRRNVEKKNFYIDKESEKPVYLLNVIKNKNLNRAFVVESQINCLYLWSLGYPAVALFGTGTNYQYEILNKSCIRDYVLMFDGDNAGRVGADKFKKNIRQDVFVTDIIMPQGKDVNDLSAEEVHKIIHAYLVDF